MTTVSRRRRAGRLVPLVLALSLAVPAPVRAQAELLIGLLGQLAVQLVVAATASLVSGAAFELTATDAKRIARFERERDWEGLAVLASERIASLPPGTPPAAGAEAGAATAAVTPSPDVAARAFWLALRGTARQRQLDCLRAIGDYAAASAAVGGLPAADLNRALCEMALGRYDDAERTLDRLTRHATLMWDAHYNLGVVRAVKRDLPGAQAALEALRPLNPVLAQLLENEFVRPLRAAAPAQAPAEAPGPTAAPVLLPAPASSDLAVAVAPGLLADNAMALDGMRLRLPPGTWVLVANQRTVLRPDRPAPAPVQYPPVPEPQLEERTAIAVAFEGAEPKAVVIVRSHPQGYLMRDRGPGLCAAGTSLHDRDDPARMGCLYVGQVLPFVRGDVPLFTLAAQTPAGTPVTLPASVPLHAFYEVHYARSGVAGQRGMYAVTLLVPVGAFAGDVAAIMWAAGVGDELRRLAEGRIGEAVITWPRR